MNDASRRIEAALDDALAATRDGPKLLAAAMRDAVFPGGRRVRPRLCLAVAQACGGTDRALAVSVAASIELLHCASLVHDDLPCFDDAPLRRGAPSVQARHGQPLAVLAGDGLIVLAVETLARGAAAARALAELVLLFSESAGAGRGLVGGQGWESEPAVPLSTYHRAKTASLFVLAAAGGALAAGAASAPWRPLGTLLGEAYQVADDVRDAMLSTASLGKPAGRDAALGRPSAALREGSEAALGRVETLVRDAVGAIPACPGAARLRGLILDELTTLLPPELVLRAAA